jgi:predicted RNase H-like nuclease (RuvC/YqgF family)
MAAPAGHPEPAAAPEAEEPESTGPATIQDAIEQVNDVIEKLRQSLDEMEEVLELLETVERQSTADQQEIESLRRALRPLQRPREGHRSQR